ncbi:hypothetical protein GIB67_001860, partial [Kingdonia uniflora]
MSVVGFEKMLQLAERGDGGLLNSMEPTEQFFLQDRHNFEMMGDGVCLDSIKHGSSAWIVRVYGLDPVVEVLQECKRNTEVVFDHSAGDTVFSKYGLVLESHSIDETSEWRTFVNEASDNDPNRVGGPSNPLLNEGSLTTVISKANGASGGDNFPRWHNRGSNPERTLVLAFKNIAVMCDRLALVPTIKIRGSFENAYQLLTSYFAEVKLVDPDFVFEIQTTSCKDKRFTRYGVAYTNHVESWNNVILKVRDLPIHVFIEELRRICLEMSYKYREEAEKSHACLTPWATDH